DAFINLVTAMLNLPDTGLTLQLYTSARPDELERLGLRGPLEIHEQVPACQAAALQCRADILFLPLAFASPYPEVIDTSAPGKRGELLASGRPVLVHAPATSFVSWYFRTHDCGLVVDRPDPGLLASALRQLLTDAGLRQRLVHNAQTRARLDFDITNARR